MTRILLITNRYPCDADDPASPFVPHFVEAVRARGVQVDVLTPRYLADRGDKEPRFVHRFAAGADRPVGSWNLLDPRSWVRLRRFLRDGHEAGRELCELRRYDHIFALWALPSGEFARRLSREFNIPYSVWCLGSDIYVWSKRPVIGGRVKKVLEGATQLFGDGEDLCGRVTSWLGLPCQFLPSYRPLAVVPLLDPPVPTDKPRYLCLGRVHRDKGVFELLEAFAAVRKILPKATLHVVGDGPDLGAMRSRASELDVHDAVSFTGPVGSAQIIEEYRRCDFVVIPSKSDSLPLVFSEAVQMNKPVIGSNVGDLGAWIWHYRVGLVLHDFTVEALTEAMTSMAGSPSFDAEGRAEMLNRLDPVFAADVFCSSVCNTGASHPSPKQRNPISRLAEFHRTV
jgi:glycosyltransferase involved in cell wall biosynthesis